MNRLTLCIAALFFLTGTARGQVNIVDAHGKLVGRYVYGNSLTTGELAIRQVGNEWIALPVSPKGFPNTNLPGFPGSSRGNLTTVQIGPKANTNVYWSGPNCNGTPYIMGYANTIMLPNEGASFLPPFVAPALIADGTAYYLATAEYGDIAIQFEITVCS